MLKRSVDIAFAGILLAVSLPMIIFAGIVIKLDSSGPVLFRQIRVGRRFKRFQLLKLRTMVSLHAGSAFTLGADPRITRCGHWLRRFKVDELPQLWHVLTGDMSLVGPRPVVPELIAEFEQEYKRLLEVRPGLTDPASLKYCRESEILAMVPDPMKYFKSVITPDKLCISEAYMCQASVGSDMSVMVKTIVALLAMSELPAPVSISRLRAAFIRKSAPRHAPTCR